MLLGAHRAGSAWDAAPPSQPADAVLPLVGFPSSTFSFFSAMFKPWLSDHSRKVAWSADPSREQGAAPDGCSPAEAAGPSAAPRPSLRRWWEPSPPGRTELAVQSRSAPSSPEDLLVAPLQRPALLLRDSGPCAE